MESKRVATIMFALYVGLICMALLSTPAAAASDKETWILQGPCSKYPDCNEYCVKNGYAKYGGKCVSLIPGKKDPLVCVCLVLN